MKISDQRGAFEPSDPAQGSDSSGLGAISEFCARQRGILEAVLATSNLHETAGTCLYAAIFLVQVLERFAGCEAVVRGGDGEGDGGARDVNGVWRGHYWVEGVSEAGVPFLADVTADQFGWPPIVVLPLAEARERYVPGDDSLCGSAVDAGIERMLEAIGM